MLPKNVATVYNLILPSTGKSLKYRQFFVKEEKALLIAQQSEEIKVMVDTLKAVVKACVLDDLDVDKIAILPNNPNKAKPNRTDLDHRLNMINITFNCFNINIH